MGKRLPEILDLIRNDSNYESVRNVVKTNLKKFMIGDSYNNEGWWQVTKISAGWAYTHIEVFLRTRDITQEQVFDTLMSFDVTILHNAQLLMDYIYTYETHDPENYLLLLDTQKLFNKLRTEMPVEFREEWAIFKKLEKLQEKGLDFKW